MENTAGTTRREQTFVGTDGVGFEVSGNRWVWIQNPVSVQLSTVEVMMLNEFLTLIYDTNTCKVVETNKRYLGTNNVKDWRQIRSKNVLLCFLKHCQNNVITVAEFWAAELEEMGTVVYQTAVHPFVCLCVSDADIMIKQCAVEHKCLKGWVKMTPCKHTGHGPTPYSNFHFRNFNGIVGFPFGSAICLFIMLRESRTLGEF